MSLASLPIQHPSWVYLTLAPVLTLGALSPTPSFAPLILLVALLRLHFTAIIPRRAWRSAISQVVLISLATALANAAPSLRALSTPAISLLVLAGLSALTTTVAAGTIALSYFVERDGSSKQGWTRATAFPAAWATIWALVERCSPIGQLATWGPVVNLGGYSWLRPVGGQVAVNWVVASWAVVLSDVAGAWMMGLVGDRNLVLEEDLISVAADDDDDDGASTRPTATPVRPLITPKTRRTLLLMGFLVLLAAPSYVLTELPPPVNAPDATAFGVACAMPYAQKNGRPKGPPSLADYVHESRTLQSQAKVILWPESAVHFTKAGEREEELAKIRPQINNGTYYGIGFEEVVYEDSPDGVWKAGMRRNGLVLLGWEGVVYEYYKRHLVPVAESFSMTPSNEKPSIFTMELHAPAGWTKPSWSPNEKHTRPVDLTASICLDFTTSASFADLPSRPALILAPARTWHTSIGLAMWEQAKARAEETGSMVLWCDGGEGGVSGVAGRGMRAFRQVGPGSWVQTISVPWPFDNRRTMFATFGTSSAVVLLWLVAGMGAFASSAVGHVTDGQRGAGKTPARLAAAVQHAVGFLRNIGQRERRDEERPLLG
ncbi:hypothetical protein PYCCODRAFT_1438228 [Trametes coccinea BRFM310]|uniref:CN hydrolase domain-containing protein n=1 Tax=Trametes coccinea (strain BRFM310) TaxID=1353009 RepID=A0A1Y2IHQ8_TRAC3|nr:hypothetical protein PYCCODRAFT_1438228 [Trametes coccinea BRFM310]